MAAIATALVAFSLLAGLSPGRGGTGVTAASIKLVLGCGMLFLSWVPVVEGVACAPAPG
ncbi:hypothetical protein EDF58_11350 [Novosphingobium sp. PhB57]|uniref:hypothetical protein n=1 Tax=Novosphingobium sp. PhB57 TaxID=2485107 RepID=UPI0010D89A2A|nr:hypothetical protein [Novosphingobium sp. PhB57]TCU52908.1 hypothetical protein EDF58_11350 [Novosphingobium sp. PhB57]